MPHESTNRISLSPERAEACARVTKELVTLVCDKICTELDAEVRVAYEEGGTSMVIPFGMTMPPETELEPISDINLESHRKPSVILLLAYIIKNHTRPSEIEELCKGVMLSLGVHGKILGVDTIVEDISKAFDV